MTFVVIGGGPTGVEMAGAIAELAKRALASDFRSIDPRCARIILVEAAPRVLTPFTRSCRRRRAARWSSSASRCGSAGRDRLQQRGRPPRRRLHSDAHHHLGGRRDGVAGRPLARRGNRPCRPGQGSRRSVGARPSRRVRDRRHRRGRRCADGTTLPGVAPVAKQQGQYVARALIARREGRTVEAFRYRDFGSLATIGRQRAVAQMGRLHISGFPAWVLWSVAHIYFLIGFRNRFVVALNWAWSYITFQRGSRLITGLYAHPGDRPRRSELGCIRRRASACPGKWNRFSERTCAARRSLGGTSKWKCIRSDIFWPSPGR